MPSLSQRERILAAIMHEVSERDFANVTVAHVVARSKVSRRTFYETFDSLEGCFIAVLDEGARLVSALISDAFDREASWLDGVRRALGDLLVFFDAEPAYAHALLVEATAAGPRARLHRERHVASITAMIEERWRRPEEHSHPLDAAGVMASLLGVLHTELVSARQEPLLGLLGPLMGLATAPYLDQPSVLREVARGQDAARERLARPGYATRDSATDDIDVPELLLHPRAHRARACLFYLVEHPGASNREVATAVGIAAHAQISKLLTRLAATGVITKRPANPGGANAWSATHYGQQAAHKLEGITERQQQQPSPPIDSAAPTEPAARTGNTAERDTERVPHLDGHFRAS